MGFGEMRLMAASTAGAAAADPVSTTTRPSSPTWTPTLPPAPAMTKNVGRTSTTSRPDVWALSDSTPPCSSTTAAHPATMDFRCIPRPIIGRPWLQGAAFTLGNVTVWVHLTTEPVATMSKLFTVLVCGCVALAAGLLRVPLGVLAAAGDRNCSWQLTLRVRLTGFSNTFLGKSRVMVTAPAYPRLVIGKLLVCALTPIPGWSATTAPQE